MSNLGDLIRKHREATDMSLQNVADDAGTTKAHVWDIEKGRATNPTVKTVLNIACALRRNPLELFSAALLDQPGVTAESRQNERRALRLVGAVSTNAEKLN